MELGFFRAIPENPMRPLRTFVIIPAHNRRDVTLAALTGLRSDWVTDVFDVIVVDDGSTDGTAEAVRANHPNVHLLQGTGDLFWTGAMEMGMRYAIANGADCCVWMNDDLDFESGSIRRLVALATAKLAIVTAQGITEREELPPLPFEFLHRGSRGLLLAPPAFHGAEYVRVDTCRGNLVAIPRQVIASIGYPDGRNIPHMAGDTDYGLRATRAGIPCLVLSNATFREKEAFRDDRRSWLLSTVPVRKMLTANFGKRGILYPRMIITYNFRHWGLRGIGNVIVPYIKLFMSIIIKKLVPRRLLLRYFAQRSASYQFFGTE